MSTAEGNKTDGDLVIREMFGDCISRNFGILFLPGLCAGNFICPSTYDESHICSYLSLPNYLRANNSDGISIVRCFVCETHVRVLFIPKCECRVEDS